MSKRKRPYLKLWKANFRDGTRMLSRPAKLLFFELIMLLDDHEGAIPDDLKWLVKNLGVHDSRVVRGPLDELVLAGKLVRRDGLLTNAKVTADLDIVEDDDDGSGGAEEGRGGPGGPAREAGSSPRLVHKPVDEACTTAPLSSDCAPTAPPLSSDCALWIAQAVDPPRSFPVLYHSQSHSHRQIHELLLPSPCSPRARGDPWPALA